MKRAPRFQKKISAPVHQRLDLYALAASAAGVSLLALVSPADAEIVYTSTHQQIDVNTHLDLDLNHDGIVDFRLGNKYSFRVAIEAKLGIKPEGAGNNIAGTSEFAAALPAGVSIGGNSPFPHNGDGVMVWWFYSFSSTICCGSYGPWRNVKNRYLGLKFSIDGETHYGWARLTVGFNAPHISALLTGYAYETEANKTIKTGQTQELADFGRPASLNGMQQTERTLGMLALGVADQTIWRREEN